MSTPISNLPEPKKKTDPVTVGVDAQLARLLPFIFAPKEASIEKPRVESWKTQHADGQACRASISVMGTFNGDDDLRSLLVLFKLAQDATLNDDGSVDFTIKQHARLGHRGWNGRHGRNKDVPSTPDEVAASLLRLRLIGFMPSRIYTDDDGRRIEISEPITFLDKLRLVRRTVTDPETGDEYTDAMASRFRFNEYIRAELSTAPLKPIVFDTAMSLPRSHPYVLRAYLTFDRNLTPKNVTHYEWTAIKLLAELGLTLTDHTPSARRRFLDGLIKHLNGENISRGVLHLERRATEDGKDWKLILTRTARRPRTRQLSLPYAEGDRATGGMRAHFEQHRVTVHAEPTEHPECETCKGILALHRLHLLKPTAAPQPTAPAEVDPMTSALDVSPVTAPLAALDLDSHISGSDLPPPAAVAPAAPEQSDTTPPSARPPGVAPGEVPTA